MIVKLIVDPRPWMITRLAISWSSCSLSAHSFVARRSGLVRRIPSRLGALTVVTMDSCLKREACSASAASVAERPLSSVARTDSLRSAEGRPPKPSSLMIETVPRPGVGFTILVWTTDPSLKLDHVSSSTETTMNLSFVSSDSDPSG